MEEETTDVVIREETPGETGEAEAETPAVAVAVTLPEAGPETEAETGEEETGAVVAPLADHAESIGEIRATLAAHMAEDANWRETTDASLATLATLQAEHESRFSDELTMIRSELEEASRRPIAEVLLPPPDPSLEQEGEPEESETPLHERSVDEVAAQVAAPLKRGLTPAPPRRLRRRRG